MHANGVPIEGGKLEQNSIARRRSGERAASYFVAANGFSSALGP